MWNTESPYALQKQQMHHKNVRCGVQYRLEKSLLRIFFYDKAGNPATGVRYRKMLNDLFFNETNDLISNSTWSVLNIDMTVDK